MLAKSLLRLPKIKIPKNIFIFRLSLLSETNKLGICNNTHEYRFRSYSTQNHEQLIVESFGDPEHVLKKIPMSLPEVLQEKQVLAKVLASPINPADVNTIQGTYAIKPKFPFVPGNEAVLEIVDVGKDVKTLGVGDRVFPRRNAMGTFQTAIVENEKDFIKIPSDIDVVAASITGINPCTAYRMIEDFVTLKSGDVIIQNLANSAVGQAAIQIAADKGIQTINIVRQRPDFEELKSFLTSLGASLVLQLSDIRQSKDLLNQFPKPLLGLNGVCGKDGAEMLRLMADGGTVVTYGGMSRQPLIVPVGGLIFNDLTFRGFWMTKWSKRHENHPKRDAMFNHLFDMIRRKKLVTPPCDLVPFNNYKQAFKLAMPSKGMVGRKQILVFD